MKFIKHSVCTNFNRKLVSEYGKEPADLNTCFITTYSNYKLQLEMICHVF